MLPVPSHFKASRTSSFHPQLSSAQVRDALGGLAALPVWAAQEGPTAAGGTLPSFSAYPQQNVTAAGAPGLHDQP